MSSDITVVDASPLIVFHQVGQFDLLRGLFLQILVPTAVALEVVPSLGVLPTWIDERPVMRTLALPEKLDPGERAAIALASQLAADYIVLDDLPARRVATRLGLTVVGSLGLLIRALDYGMIEQVRPVMDQMVDHGLFVTEELYHDILVSAGEGE